jgi:hypothetical protein
MGLSPTYTCVICGYSVDPKSQGVIRQAVVWLKGTSRTVVEVVAESHQYRHAVCTTKQDLEQLELF